MVAAIVATLTFRGPAPIEVEIGVVERRDLAQVVTAKGRIAPKRYVEVVAERAGEVIEIHVKVGDTVERGQLLARLQVAKTTQVSGAEASLQLLQSEYRSVLAAIEAGKAAEAAQEASLEKGQLEVERSRHELARAVLLNKEGLISRHEFDSRVAVHRAAEAVVAVARADLERMRADRTRLGTKRAETLDQIKQGETQRRRMENVLRRFPVISPIAGVVTALHIESGADVEREQATQLMTIADVSEVKATFDDAGLTLGQTVSVNIEDSTFAGEVREVVDGSATVVLAELPEPLELGADCTIQIETAGGSPSLVVSSDALVEPSGAAGRGNKFTGVFVVEEGRVRFQPAKTGVMVDGWRVVTDGLREGQKIVTNPALKNLEPGARVIAASQN